MVVLPLAALGALGVKLIAEQRDLAEREVDNGITRLVETIADAVGTIIRSFDRELGRLALELPRTDDPAVLRESLSKLPRAMMTLVVGRDGLPVYPPPGAPTSSEELAFMQRVAWLWSNGHPPFIGARDARGRLIDRGWLPFESDGHTHFLRWQKRRDTYLVFEVKGSELASELMSQLPGSPMRALRNEARVASQTVLRSPDREVIYVWGERSLPEGARLRREIVLPRDLGGWTLQHYAEDNPLPDTLTRTLTHTVLAGLGGLGLALIAGASLIWRARTRESRIAAQRVSFVNQVSHELKTPLTNIRLYAELLEGLREADDDFDPMGAESRYLKVIGRESERLSRLIRNVLSFARGQEEKLELRMQSGVIDEVVNATLLVHGAALEQAGIIVERDLEASARMRFDGDALEQILTNLFSNIEKYGKQGKWMRVATRLSGNRAKILVEDRGPGIPEAFRERIFEPFWRLSDKASDGVTGTGIGLDIARRLARLHGGEVRLLGERPGARFEVELELERVEGEA
jgi:signal transduction histidine kinase